jgi:hypothetical protein
MAKINITISIPEELAVALDQDRGDVMRSRYVQRAIEAKLAQNNISGTLPVAPPGPITSADVQGAIKPDTKGMARRTRRKAP